MQEILEKLNRKPGSHKGENGETGIIAGSKDYMGAPALSAKAALRTGCDLTWILTSESVKTTVASYSENFIVNAYKTDFFEQKSVEKARELAEKSDALVIGPGMGEVDQTAIRDFITDLEKPIVIDADAIQPALEANISEAVFTPHGGEARKIREKYGSMEDFVTEEDVVVVLKGETDRIYTPEETFQNETGTSAMTVGGTGDVLTGVIASLISQGLEIDEAARLGIWVNGKAGEKAAEEFGNGMMATDILESIPYVLKT